MLNLGAAHAVCLSVPGVHSPHNTTRGVFLYLSSSPPLPPQNTTRGVSLPGVHSPHNTTRGVFLYLSSPPPLPPPSPQNTTRGVSVPGVHSPHNTTRGVSLPGVHPPLPPPLPHNTTTTISNCPCGRMHVYSDWACLWSLPVAASLA